MRAKQGGVMLNDILLITCSVVLSFFLRLGYAAFREVDHILLILPVILIVRMIIFLLHGLYQGMWRFTGARDLVAIIQAVTLSSIVSVSILFLTGQVTLFPRSVFIIDWFVTLNLIAGSRFAYRLIRSGTRISLGRLGGKRAKNILIVGAGHAGEMIAREIIGRYHRSYRLIGYVDDHRGKRNRTIHGYRVLGNTRDLPALVARLAIDEVFLAIPSAPTKAKRRIVRLCTRAKIPFKTLPAFGQLLDGSVKVSALRDFEIEDLLGREPARLDTQSIADYVRNKTVLITGAGGSIGSELCRQVAQFSPRRIVLFERNEFNLYQIHLNLLELVPGQEIHAIIGDVLSQSRFERALKEYRPEVVFHAAAYKHVPLMEMNPEEALKNNVQGTWNVAHLCHAHGVHKFVMVSTDKAVRPTNVMGASKRIAELVCQGFGKYSSTQFVTVRFGNVLNSVGSVIPLFKQQIAKGGPVTVTHPEIYRYFMTIPESVQLILQAGAMGRGGEIFLLDMGEPVRIADLARDMVRLSGLEPGKDIKIQFTGLRAGEKLYEELLTDGEEIKATLHEKIKIAGSEHINWKELLEDIDDLIESLADGFSQRTVEAIKKIVPEYQPENGGPQTSTEQMHGSSRNNVGGQRRDPLFPLTDKRKDARASCVSKVTCRAQAENKVFGAEILNLSSTGICIRVDTPPAAQQVVNLETDLPFTSNRFVVRWIKGVSGGLYLVGMSCD